MNFDLPDNARSVEQKSMADEPAQMPSAGWRYFAGGCFVGVGSACLIASADLLKWQGPNRSQTLGIGLVFGILHGQGICLSLWSSWGRGSHLIRFLFLVVAETAFFISLCLLEARLSPRGGISILIFAKLIQTAIVYPLGWLARLIFGVRIVFRRFDRLPNDQTLQFGIAHLMGLTVAIAILLALGQLLIRHYKFDLSSEFFLLLFLVVAAILIAIPVLTACLVDRQLVWMLPLAVLSAILVGAIEQPIYVQLTRQSGVEIYDFLAINLFTFLNVMSFSFGLRLLGYRLTIGKSGNDSQ